MESVYGTYDSSFLFGKLRDKLYTPSDEIVALKNAYGRNTRLLYTPSDEIVALKNAYGRNTRLLYTPSDEIVALKNAYGRNTRLKGLDLAIPKRLEVSALNQRERAQGARISKGGAHLISTSVQPGQNGLKKTA